MSEATWTIVGEAGKAVDETPHPLAELQAEDLEPEFNSLEPDRLEWSIKFAEPDGSDVIIPELGQQISLLRDGVRQFQGTVVDRRVRLTDDEWIASIVVCGPWWWLDNLPLSDLVEDAAENQRERTQFVFPVGTIATHLSALVTRAVALGAPVQLGTLATTYEVPRLALRDMSFASAIARIMNLLPDGVIYFDYSASPHPALCLSRRGSATTLALDADVDVLTRVDLRPRIEAQLEEVKVVSASRATVDNARVTVFNEQTAGSMTSGLPRRQVTLVSGPELDTFVPADELDSVVVQSRALGALALRQVQPVFDATSAGTLAIGPAYEQLGSAHINIPGINFTGFAPGGVRKLYEYGLRVTDRNGNDLPAGFDFFLTKGEPRDWWADAGIEHIDAVVAAIVYQKLTKLGTQPAGPSETPEWAEILGATPTHFWISGTWHSWWHTLVTGVVVAVKTNWASDTTLIRPEDYSWYAPPANLATNLLAAQNWLPYEGAIERQRLDEIPSGHRVGHKTNLAGALPEHAAMGALITGHSYSLQTKSESFRHGNPRRLAYRDLVTAFRGDGTSNLFFV